MIRLKPVLEMPARPCPNCGAALAATDFLIAGMRNLADLRCARCGGEFYGDLPAGQGLYTPILLDKKSGAVDGDPSAEWFADWLRDAYKERSSEPICFETRKFSAVKSKAILLNCLDALYGHSLLKLLNAQHYIDCEPDASLIVIVPPFLEWLLPAGVAEAWIADVPLRRGTSWNDWLAGEIKKRLEQFDEVFLSVAFSHPSAEDFDIERFTRVAPFALEKFGARPQNPFVTFVWREDRLWEADAANVSTATRFGRLKNRLRRAPENRIGEQARRVVEFAERLRGEISNVDFAVVGLGATTNFPAWISDLRLEKLDASAERAWCERYAASHLVVGVHGSNMLLPSAHAGAVVELLGEDRFGNFLQDILFRPAADARETLFRCRFAPLGCAPEQLARLAISMLRFDEFRRLMSPEFSRHRAKYDFERFETARKKNSGKNERI